MYVNLLPARDNKNVKALISLLKIEGEPFLVDLIPEAFAINGECFPNVQMKILKDKGGEVLGWQFCEYDYMIEAEFHAIWKSPEGKLVDITPSANPNAKQILFIIDKNKKYEGTPTDNERLNTTTNELVDDMIEFERAKFRFTSKIEKVDISGRLLFNADEQLIWNELNHHANILEQMYYAGCTIQSECCNPGTSYNSCHRKILKSFLTAI